MGNTDVEPMAPRQYNARMKRSDAIKIAMTEMQRHGLIDREWKFVFDERPRKRLGQCRYHCKEIGLTGWYVDLNDVAEVTDTILHEIAHALNGRKGHGADWVEWCHKLGCSPKAKVDIRHLMFMQQLWSASCSCGQSFSKSGHPVNSYNYFCRCGLPLRFRRNEQELLFKGTKVSSAAQSFIADATIDGLIDEFASASTARRKTIRAKLRRMGYRGSYRKPSD